MILQGIYEALYLLFTFDSEIYTIIFLSLFISRFIPFVRVLTPMLMGVARLNIFRTIMISVTSSVIWVLTLLYAGKSIMRHPFLSQHQELLTKWFLLISLILMITAFITLFIRIIRKRITV